MNTWQQSRMCLEDLGERETHPGIVTVAAVAAAAIAAIAAVAAVNCCW